MLTKKIVLSECNHTNVRWHSYNRSLALRQTFDSKHKPIIAIAPSHNLNAFARQHLSFFSTNGIVFPTIVLHN